MLTNESDPSWNPQGIEADSELDREYIEELEHLTTHEQFVAFLTKYDYWLDDKVKSLKGYDWNRLQVLMAECRNKEIKPSDEHLVVMNLMVPFRIIKVCMVAQQYDVPWGCAYVQMRRAGVIDY